MIFVVKNGFAFVESSTPSEISWLKSKLTFEQYSGKDKSVLFKSDGDFYTYGHLARILKREAPFNIGVKEEKIKEKLAVQVDPNCLEGITLRDYQVKTVKKAIRGKHGILKLPTGAGKGAIILAVLKNLNFKQAVIIVPTTTLAEDLFSRAVKSGFNPKDVGIVHGTKKESRKIIFAVAASVNSAIKNKSELIKYLKNCDVLVGDEIQHIASDSWKRIWLTSKAKYKLGFSASPFTTLEGYELASYQDASVAGVAGPLLVDISNKFLVDSGYISKTFIHYISLKGRKVFYRTSMAALNKREIVENKERNRHIAETAKRAVGLGFQVLILVTQHNHARKLMEELSEHSVLCKFGGSKALVFDDETGQIEDVSIGSNWTERVASGEWEIVIGSNVLDEGVDISSIGFMILAGAGKSLRLQTQRKGRGSRLKEKGENSVYLVDFIDRAHVYLYSHYTKRKAIFLESGAEMLDDKFRFWRKVEAHSKSIKDLEERDV